MEHLSIIRERYTCLLNFDVQLLPQRKLGQLIHSILSVSDLPLPTVKSPNLVLPLPFQFQATSLFARFLIEAASSNLRDDTCFAAYLLEASKCSIKCFIRLNSDMDHCIKPTPLLMLGVLAIGDRLCRKHRMNNHEKA